MSSDIHNNKVIIWLDTNFNDSNENTIIELKNIVNCVKTFTDVDQCFNFLSNVKNEKIFMIISNSSDQYLTFLLHFMDDVSQVHSIYIVSNQNNKYEQYKKVKGVFIEIESIFNTLKQDVHRCENSISFNNSHLKDLGAIDPSYIYSKLLIEIILKIDYKKEAMNELIRYWREQFVGNISVLKKVDHFEQEYQQHSPIWWYTGESYIYSMINQALRTFNVDFIIKMGFIIRDVYRQIEQLHAEHQYTEKLTVYRGQGLSNIDFDKMKQSIGGLLTFNSFLSTTFDREVSLMFAESNRYNPDMIGVLFQMEIDPSISSIPFARIDDVNYFNDDPEILISSNSIFRINTIEQIEHQLWEVNLTMTNNKDLQSEFLINCIRQEIKDENPLRSLALLLNKLGYYDTAQKINQQLLETTSSIANYSNAGLIHQSMGNFNMALFYYEKTLDNDLKSYPSDHLVHAINYNNIGSVYQSLGEYSKALSYYEKSLEIKLKCLSATHLSIATTYNHIGEVYNSIGEYTKALSYHERALEIEKTLFRFDHPSIAITYNNIGSVHRSLGNYSIALLSYKKTLDIEQHVLQYGHPSFSTTYNNIGLIYSLLKDYSTALSYYEKALRIAQKTCSSNHSSLALIYNNIGEVYDSMKNSSEALEYYQKALEIQHKYLPPNHPELAAVYNNIGEVYRAIGNYPKAISYYEKTLEIELKFYSLNHPSLAITYINIAVAYESQQRYDDAINYTNKAIDIFQKIFGLDHSKTKEIQAYLDELQQKL